MSEPFLAEIRIVGFTFAPRGWAFCDGQILTITQNQSLYSLLGTTYGGDGRTTFALPELRGRTPMHVGTGFESTYTLGQKAGEETHSVSVAEMPAHNHVLQANSSAADVRVPNDNVFANADVNAFRSAAGATAQSMHPGTLLPAGGGQAHENMSPYLALNFCIALQGLFPSRN